MSVVVTIVDYGMGNIFSIINALGKVGAEPRLSGDPREVASADRVVLPGVGAFKDGMEGLAERGLVEALREFAARERPLLGICLGMQMMLDTGLEFGVWDGLGLIPGTVERIQDTGVDGRPHKIPHIGWNRLIPPHEGAWRGTILENVEPGSRAYFVHSFMAMPVNEEHRMADTYYNGRRITAAVRRGCLYGCQFHPEKSGRVGLGILSQFLAG
ncbi:MAG: imidazole glycerol phosphate synthase subunit HisH [Thermodesulfobacteriota bacterium]